MQLHLIKYPKCEYGATDCRKVMETKEGSNGVSHVSGSKILEGKSGGSSVEEISSQDVGFPKIEFEDDQESINLSPWAAIEAGAFL